MPKIDDDIKNIKFGFESNAKEPQKFFTMGEVTTDPDLGRVVNIHCSGVSFGLPVAELTSLISSNPPLQQHIGEYFKISGQDHKGLLKEFSIKIDENTSEKFAWNLFTTLGVENGNDFVQENWSKWDKWFK
jgi:hypothetical protein